MARRSLWVNMRKIWNKQAHILKGILRWSWLTLVIKFNVSWSTYIIVDIGWSGLILNDSVWSWLILIDQNDQIICHSRIFTSWLFQKFHILNQFRIFTLSTGPWFSFYKTLNKFTLRIIQEQHIPLFLGRVFFFGFGCFVHTLQEMQCPVCRIFFLLILPSHQTPQTYISNKIP